MYNARTMKVTIPDDVVFRDVGGEAVLLNLVTGTYFGLDEVGTRIWHLVGEHGSTEPVIAALLAEYEVDEPKVRQDVDRLIRQLLDTGLVRAAPSDATPPG